MNKYLDFTKAANFNGSITITGSKSESNRLLILQQLYPNLKIENLGNANDVKVLQKALTSNKKKINIGHAGTAMRFLTAYFSSINKEVILTGSDRMQNRPIKILVDTLTILGAKITYLEKNGYPPIHIKGKQLLNGTVKINAAVSSQYITALLLIAPSLKNGLTLELQDKITSKPYVEMTLSLLNNIGVKTEWFLDKIKIHPLKKIKNTTIIIESDWSSASYFYSLVALSKNGKITLSHFNKNSLQGDKVIAEIYKQFGVSTSFKNNTITISKDEKFKPKKHLNFNLIQSPDIAQTITVTCFGLGISCGITGLHTLKIKETDRLEALKTELKKLGAKVRITADSLHLRVIQNSKFKIQNSICTYQDHRMAMAFAPLSLLMPITIKESAVVKKSYPNFWEDLEKIMS